MRAKILIIDKVNKILSDKLLQAGFEISEGMNLSREDIISKQENFTGIVVRSRIVIDKEIIDNIPGLKFIARLGSGLENIDTAYCNRKKIICLNSPEGNRDAVGEQCTGMLLSLLNNLNTADKQVKAGIWKREQNRGIELKGKTVGIIGYGNTGSSFAKKISGFECNVISYDKYKKNYSDNFTKETDLAEIFKQADILSIHVPLTDETFYMVDGNFINKFSKNFILLNTARGQVVKTSALVEGLKSGKVISAGLDVIEYEDFSFENPQNILSIPEFKYLANSDNVILSPHIAGWSNESEVKLAEVLADKIIELRTN